MGGVDAQSSRRRHGSKKKALDQAKQQAPQPAKRENSFKSIFSPADKSIKSTPVFLPPEAFGSAAGLAGDEEIAHDLSSASAWDVAIRYHELRNRPAFRPIAKQLRKLSAEAILARAQEVLGSVVHPVERRTLSLRDLPGTAEQTDFDLDESVENSPLAIASVADPVRYGDFPITDEDIWMSYSVPRHQPVVLSVDTSLSMTGEKLALTAVAIAVVLLQFPDDPVGIVAFENEGKVLKRPEERISIQQLVERFIDVPAQGYTHLEDGMKVALRLVRDAASGGTGRPPSAVLLTDGKYTAGKDPAYLAARFPHLVVLKMGREKASLGLCRELAQKGSGALREVAELESLPSVMYGVVKDLLRGRSLA